MKSIQETCWEGRSWIPYDYSATYLRTPRTNRSFRFISYNTLSDHKCALLHYTTTKNWKQRCHSLLNEIITYNADIICLQDCDHYDDWWRPQLSLLDYDTVYKKRTQKNGFHYEGVLIAFRREMFQLFKSLSLELNDAVQDDEQGRSFRDRCVTDDVAIIAFLQPWSEECVKSAICVCSVMLSDERDNHDVRMAQVKYLTREIELANKEFLVPVLFGMSMYDIPPSLPYGMMATGRSPLAGQVPKKCHAPIGHPSSRNSMRLTWFPPQSTIADSPILFYRVAWRPGGSSTLGFRATQDVPVGDCVQYAQRLDERTGKMRMTALEERAFTIPNLVSDVPYEFKIVAVNEVGQGVWSDVSTPVIMNNPDNAPEMPELVNFANLEELKQIREMKAMREDDRNSLKSLRMDAMGAQTQLTPRNMEGDINPLVARARVLPHSVNPREGWKDSLHGLPDPRIKETMMLESVLLRSLLRDHQGFLQRELNYYSDLDPVQAALDSSAAEVAAAANAVDAVTSVVLQDGGGIADFGASVIAEDSVDTFGSAVVGGGEGEGTGGGNGGGSGTTAHSTASASIAAASQSSNASHILSMVERERARVRDKESVILDCREVLETVGVPNRRQVHELGLRSAYMSYGPSGEPLFTCSMPSEKNHKGTDCLDYIFYTHDTLRVRSLLSMPLLNDIRHGERPEAACCREDPNYMMAPYTAQNAFDAPLHKLNEAIGVKIKHPPVTSSSDSSSTSGETGYYDATRAKVDLLYSSTQLATNQHVSRSKISDAKRQLKASLLKSHKAGNEVATITLNTAVLNIGGGWDDEEEEEQGGGGEEEEVDQGEYIDHHSEESAGAASQQKGDTVGNSGGNKTTGAGTGAGRFLGYIAGSAKQSDLWGGQWAPLGTINHQRSNFWLPSEAYPSSHIALGAEFELNDFQLSTMWNV